MTAPNPDSDHDDNALPARAAQPDSVRHVARVDPRALSTELRPAESAPDDDEIDLRALWQVLVKRKATVLGVMAAVFVVALVATLLMTPIFRATGVLQIERDTVKVVQVEGLTPVESPGDKDFYQTQYELLQSRALAQRVAGQLNLADSPVFERMNRPSPLRAAVNTVLGMLPRRATAQPQGEDAALAAAERGRVSAFLNFLTIEPVRNSRLVKINYDSPDPAFSARVVNALSEAFIAANLERRFDASSYAKTYLEDRLQQMRQRLEDAESQLVQFARAEGIIAIDNRESLVGSNLSDLNTALSRAQDERARAEAKWRQTKTSAGASLPAVLASELIQNLQTKRADVVAEYQDKLRIFKPGYPLLNQLSGQIAELDRQIANEVANVKSSIANEYQTAVEQERLLRTELNSLRNQALDLQQRSVKYNILKREVDTSRQLYDGLLQRYREIGIAGGVGTNNISIVDHAEIPGSPFKPNLQLNLVLGLMLGLFGGVALAFLLEYLDDSIKSPEDVEKALGLPVVGVIPLLRNTTPEQALAESRSAFAEAYRSVRTALQFSTEQGVPKSLLVTSSVPTEGKSTTASALARNFAQLGQRVLLIDADLRNPSLHKLLGADNGVGLSSYLAGAAKASEIVRSHPELPQLHIITSGPLPPNPAELLAGPRLLSFLGMAAERYDQIILDGPPIMGLADAPIVASMAAGTLLVIEAGSTRTGQAKDAAKRLLASRARVIGTLLTKHHDRHARYGGYGGYGYYAYGTTTGALEK